MKSDSSAGSSISIDKSDDPTYAPNLYSHFLNNSDTPIEINNESFVSAANIVFDKTSKTETILSDINNNHVNDCRSLWW